MLLYSYFKKDEIYSYFKVMSVNQLYPLNEGFFSLYFSDLRMTMGTGKDEPDLGMYPAHIFD